MEDMTNVLPQQRAPGILRETARTGPSVRCRRKATPSLAAAPDYAGRRQGTAADRKALANVADGDATPDCRVSSRRRWIRGVDPRTRRLRMASHSGQNGLPPGRHCRPAAARL